MKMFKRFTVIALVICLLCSMTQVFAVDSIVTLKVKGTQDFSEAYDVLEIVNQHRAEAGLSILKMDEELMMAAMQRAAECTIYFDHTRPDGTRCFTAFPDKFTWGASGENIALGQRNAAAVMNSWMNSPGHHDNIMDPDFNTIGIGCFYQDGYLSWVQLFSSRSADEPSTPPADTTVTASVNALPNYLQIVCGVDYAGELNHYDLSMYNVNLNPEVPLEYIELSNTDFSYTSSDNTIVKITNGTLLEEISAGTAILRGYINGVQVFEAEYTVEEIAHEHVYEETVTPPTCTSGGYTTCTCSICGDTYVSETTDKVPHDYQATVTPPTCSGGGYTTYTCPDCGKTYTDDETDSLPHRYNAVVTPPTCANYGYTTYTCTECGEEYFDDETEPLPHDYHAVVTEPTCNQDGFTTYTCSVCGEEYIDNKIAPLPHDYEAVVTPPTYISGGFTTYTCKDCGDTYIGDRTEPLSHNYEAVVTPPSCTAGGYTTYTCTDCGHTYIADETNPIPHEFTETVVPPTEREEGYTIFDCKNCEYYFYGDFTDPVTPPADYILGDANGDGEVSNSDLVAMARYVVGLASDIDITAADIDKNGEITNTDLITVARFIVGLE